MRKYALVVLALVGCTEAKTTNRDPATDLPIVHVGVPSLTAEDSIGAEEVHITSAALDAHVAIAPKLLMTIADAGTANAFSSVSSISVSPASDVYVADEQANVVYRFGPDGKLLGRVGGSGEGPGELMYPRFTAVIGDSLFVYDARALNVFTVAGKFVDRAEARPPKSFGSGMAESFAVAKGRIVLGHTMNYARVKPTAFRDTLAISTIDMRTKTVSDPFVFVIGVDKYKALNADIVPAFGAIRYHAVADDGRVFVTGRDGASINVVSDVSALQRRIVFDTPRRSVSAVDRRKYMDEADASVNRYARPQDRAAILSAIRAMPVAPEFPVVAEIIASPEGALLVHRRDLDQGDAKTWEYLGADFAPRARLVLPKNFKPAVVRNGLIYGVTKSDLDEQVVSIYRLP